MMERVISPKILGRKQKILAPQHGLIQVVSFRILEEKHQK